MAVFNPPINPTEDPSYLGLSKPITQPQSDQTAGIALKGLGDTVGMAIKGADWIVKQNIKQSLYDDLNENREEFTKTAEVARSDRTGEPLNIMSDAQKGNIPTELKALPRRIQSLQSAGDSGKIPKTHYLGRANEILKDYRSRYPGYREFIDETASSIMGGNVANMYLNQVLADANSVKEEKDRYKKDVLDLAKQNIRFEGMQQIYDGVNNGTLTPEQGMKEISTKLEWKGRLERNHAERQEMQGSREDLKRKEVDDFAYESSVSIANKMDNVRVAAGNRTLREMLELAEQHANGKIQIPDEQFVGMAQAFRSARAAYIRERQASAGQKYADGSTRLSRMGKSEYDSVVNANLAGMDEIIKNIEDKNFGLAATSAAFLKAKVDSTMGGMVRDQDNGHYFLMMKAIRELGGDAAAQRYYIDILADPGAGASKISQFLDIQGKKAMSQVPDVRKQDSQKVYTLNDSLTEAERETYTDPKTLNNMIKRVDMLTDPKYKASDGVKLNIARYFFDPANAGSMSRFNPDSFDESGRPIAGRHTAFSKITKPEVTREIKRLANTYDQNIWTNYVNWVENTFANDIYTKDIRSMTGMQLPQGAQIAFDSEKNKFKLMLKGMDMLEPGSGAAWNRINRPYGQYNPSVPSAGATYGDVLEPASETFNTARRVLNRLNTGLDQVSVVAKETGQNVGVYLLQLMIRTGFNPKAGNGVSIPDEIAAALYAPVRREAEDKLKKELNKK